MKHAEIVFEPGAHSLLSFDNEDELKAFLSEHHRRALSGDAGGPTGHSAERISRVIVYDDNPTDMHPSTVSTDTLGTLGEGMAKDGQVSSEQLVAALRDEVSPVYPQDQGRHQSMYKAEGTDYDLSFLADAANPGTTGADTTDTGTGE